MQELHLRNCPFCGVKPQARSVRFGSDLTDRWAVCCPRCGIVMGWYFDRYDAAKRWNARPKGVKDQ